MRIRVLTAVTLSLGLLSQFACDQKEGDRSSTSRNHQTGTAETAAASSDQAFVTSAAQANLAEIDAGRIATARSSSSDVKMFAQHMIDDHSKANKDLTDLARRKGLTVPEVTDDAHVKDLASLAQLSGADFDKKYASMMVDDHGKAVSLFEETARSAKDKDLRAFAQKLAPRLREHLQMARDLSGKLGAPSAD
jgi:putative membrane protein